MSYIYVTASRLRQCSEELVQLNEQFKAGTAELDSKESSLKSQWEGEANETFHTAFVRDRGQMDAFYDAISRYAAILLVIAEKYEEAERENAAIASERVY